MRNEFRRKFSLAAGAALAMLALVLYGCTAEAAETHVPDAPLAVMDRPAVEQDQHLELVLYTVEEPTETVTEPEPEPELEAEPEYVEPFYEPACEAEYEAPATGTYYAEYNELYNIDGPTREMPGWYDGYLETYYSSNVMHHYLTDEWEVDDEGFYRTTDGYYVVGVDLAEGIEIGTVIDTGKGEAVVMDYGSGAHVHDFYTAW